jgi:hypothetical protein
LVDNAFKILAHELNRLLIEIASRQGHQISKAGNPTKYVSDVIFFELLIHMQLASKIK